MKHSWQDFSLAEPELAAFGEKRLKNVPSYLATVRTDGLPRVHPVTPIIAEGHLFLFMEPTSPKGKDLERDARYTLHCSVENSSGGDGEFYVRGRASLTSDPLMRQQAVQASSYAPAEQYVLFVFTIEFAFMNNYVDGKPDTRRWQSPD